MSKTRRILIIGNFSDTSLKDISLGRRYLLKGLIRLGHDVQTFSHYKALIFSSSVPSKTFAPFLAQKKAKQMLLSRIQEYHPQIVILLGIRVKYLRAETLESIHEVIPQAVFVGREHDPDPLHKLDPIRKQLARQMNLVVCTGADGLLQVYKNVGVPKCAYLPNACDPDLQHRYKVDEKWGCDIIFTGKTRNPKAPRDPDQLRAQILLKLSKMPNVRLYGCFDHPKIYAMDFFYATSGAKIALSINMVNDVELYHSNRLVNSIACGTFTLAKYVPGSELLFEDGVHLKYFDTAEEFFELADWYLKHDAERERIAKAGMEKAHRDFNCVKMAGHLMDLIEKGTIDAPWARIL